MSLKLIHPDGDFEPTFPPNAKKGRIFHDPKGLYQSITYFVAKKEVGSRLVTYDGEIDERSCCNGVRHGWERYWHSNGRLSYETFWVDGKEHGVGRQWGEDGKFWGSYRMVHGTGTHVWRQPDEDGVVRPAEIYQMKDGVSHGWQWWTEGYPSTVFIERHYWNGKLHGIEREWNAKGRLCRGFPSYWVNGEKKNKRTYLLATATDKSLPAFRDRENSPERTLPNLDSPRMIRRSDRG